MKKTPLTKNFKQTILTVSASAMMLGASNAQVSIGINFSGGIYPNYTGQNAYNGAYYCGFPVTATAFGVDAGNWYTTTNGTSASIPYSYSDSGTMIVGSANTLNVNWNVLDCWGSQIDYLSGYTNSSGISIPKPGNDEVTWGVLDNVGWSISLSGLNATFPNGYVIQCIAAGKVTTNSAINITDGASYAAAFKFSSIYTAGNASYSGPVGLQLETQPLSSDSITITNVSRDASSALSCSLAGFLVTDKPVVSYSPTVVTNVPGSGLTLSTVVIGLTNGLAYQWWLNGARLTGATNENYTKSVTTFSDAGNYQLVATNLYGSGTSSVVLVDVPSTPVFLAQMPAANALSVSTGSVISVEIQDGNLLNTNTITLSLDGALTTPMIVQNTNTFLTTASYQPVSPLVAGTTHTVQVVVKDTSSVAYTNIWHFTTGYAALPVTIPGPIGPISGGGAGLVIFSATGDAWLGTNYNSSSSRTLYTRFSMTFNDLDGQIGLGGLFGGLEFYKGTAEQLLIGDNWMNALWSTAGGAPNDNLSPATFIATNDWHTVVVRTDYSPNNNDTVTIWLDPDFTQSEADQPNAPLVLSMDNTFDSVHLRCGNDSASATFSNIVVASTTTGAGFAAPAVPQFQDYMPGISAANVSPSTAIGLGVVFGSYGISTNAITMTLDGNVVTPSFVAATNAITISYQPTAAFAVGSTHAIAVSLNDSNGTPYSTSWSFSVDQYPSLPVTLAGPYSVSDGNDTIFLTGQNGAIGEGYNTNFSGTLYIRFSMQFDLPDSEGGDIFGGLDLYDGNNEVLLTGKAWDEADWEAIDAYNGGVDYPLNPDTTINSGEWHTLVEKIQFVPGGNDNVSVWLDPNFTLSEAAQTNAPVTFTTDCSFDNLHLRCGDDDNTASAEYTNIVVAVNGAEIGFAASTISVMSIQKSSGGIQLSWTGSGTLQQASTLTGTWTNSVNQADPQILSATNSSLFFRIKQ